MAADDDAGTSEYTTLECLGYDWKLAPGFRPARSVDYIADRNIEIDASSNAQVKTLSSAGVACATATERERCLSALEQPQSVFTERHLATTEGDNVRIWKLAAAPALLGLIDTPAEALWLANANHFEVPCHATIEQVADGFVIRGALLPSGCVGSPRFALYVQGTTAKLSTQTSGSEQPVNCNGMAF